MTKLAQQLAMGYYRTKFRILSALSKKKAAEIALELFSTPQFRYKRPLPRIFEDAGKINFRIHGETVTGYRWNIGGQRRVLIAHGFNSSVARFDRYIRPLVSKGYEVLAFDAPAHGFSSGKTINVVVYKDMILAIQEKYGPVQSFMGHSFGGLAICLALEDIPPIEECRIVLIAPATESRTAIDLFFSFLNLNEAVRKEFDRQIYNLRNQPPEWYSVSRAVRSIKAKILWCHDEDDPITPWIDARKVMEKNHSNIEFVVTKGLGHRKIYRDNHVFKTIVDFL